MYKRDYAYKELKRPTALLRRLKGKNLVSMTISQFEAPDKITHDHLPTYLTTHATYDKDGFKTLGFELFSSQNLLLSYLRDNASGLYKETAPMSFVAEKGIPFYAYRSFNLDGTNYTLVHSIDCGLCYHILLGDHGFQMPIGLSKTKFTRPLDIYNIYTLINYGLLGRNTGISLDSDLNFAYNYDLEQTFITYSNIPGQQAKPESKFSMRFFNQSANLNWSNTNHTAIEIYPDYESQHKFANGQGLPKFSLQIKTYNQAKTKPVSTLTLEYNWLA